MTALVRDLRYACRLLAKSPGFTLAAGATLALAVGLNAAVFSIVNALLFRPLPVSAPAELVRIYSSVPRELMTHAPMSTADYQDLRRECTSFTDVAASWLTTMALEDAGDGRLVLVEPASSNYFATLGVEPRLGQGFTSAEGPTGAAVSPLGGPSVVVLSHTAWQRRFGADPRVVGRTIRLNGHSYTVAGIAPEGFFGLHRGVSPELWLPMAEARARRSEDRERRLLWVVARLQRGASLAQGRAEVEMVARRLREEFPDTNRDRAFVVLPSRAVRILPGIDATLYPASLVSLGVVGLVLLVACSNLAHLLLVRALGRRREIGTRRALGASRLALVRQLLAEGFVLSLLGGLAGLVFAYWVHLVFAALPDSLPVDVVLGLAVDWRVVLFTMAASTLTTLTFATAPALEATRVNLASTLRQSGDAGRGKRTVRRVLLTSQVALSLLLLVCAGLAQRSMANAQRIHPGFDPQGVVVASFAPGLQGYDQQQVEGFYRDLLSQVRALPDTVAAGLASHLPLTVEVAYERASPSDAGTPLEEWPNVDTSFVGPGYFEAMGIPIVRGRPFLDRDTATAPLVAVVNESLAEGFWPRSQALGQRLRIAGADGEREIVGIVPDGKYRLLGEPPRAFVFQAFGQWLGRRRGHAGEIQLGFQTLVVRTRGAPSVDLAAIRRTARQLDEDLAITRQTTLAEATSLPLLLPRAAAALFTIVGAVGLLLVAVGIAGVASYSASRRHHEIGIRLALGARRRDIERLLMGEGLAVTAIGVGLGLLLAATTTRALSVMLYGVHPVDPPTYLGAAFFVAVVAAAASYVPARRASGSDPQDTLRHE